MAEFRMVADICFDADDLDDAFRQLREHFEVLEHTADDQDDKWPQDAVTVTKESLDFVGTIVIALSDNEKVNWQTGEMLA